MDNFEAIAPFIVFIVGTCVSIYILTHIKLVLQKVKSWIATAVLSLGTIALAFFCISLPKVNGILFKMGTALLQTTKVEKDLHDKQSELASLEARISSKKDNLRSIEADLSLKSSDFASAAFSRLLKEVNQAKAEGKSSVKSDSGLLYMSLPTAMSLAPTIKLPTANGKVPPKDWLTIYQAGSKSESATSSVSAAFLIDTENNRVTSFSLTPEDFNGLLGESGDKK